jgi:hypothetical protein
MKTVLTSKPTSQIVELWGMPGVGKTHLAAGLLQYLKDDTLRLKEPSLVRRFGCFLLKDLAYSSMVFPLFILATGHVSAISLRRALKIYKTLLFMIAATGPHRFTILDEGPLTWITNTRFINKKYEVLCWRYLILLYQRLHVVTFEVRAVEEKRVSQLANRRGNLKLRNSVLIDDNIKLFGKERADKLAANRQIIISLNELGPIESTICYPIFIDLLNGASRSTPNSGL